MAIIGLSLLRAGGGLCALRGLPLVRAGAGCVIACGLSALGGLPGWGRLGGPYKIASLLSDAMDPLWAYRVLSVRSESENRSSRSSTVVDLGQVTGGWDLLLLGLPLLGWYSLGVDAGVGPLLSLTRGRVARVFPAVSWCSPWEEAMGRCELGGRPRLRGRGGAGAAVAEAGHCSV